MALIVILNADGKTDVVWHCAATEVLFNLVPTPQDDTMHTRRACAIKSLCIYLNEDPEKTSEGIFDELMRKYSFKNPYILYLGHVFPCLLQQECDMLEHMTFSSN